jgi:hypothetical protein
LVEPHPVRVATSPNSGRVTQASVSRDNIVFDGQNDSNTMVIDSDSDKDEVDSRATKDIRATRLDKGKGKELLASGSGSGASKGQSSAKFSRTIKDEP